ITGRHKNRIDVLAGEEQGDERCRLALDMECYRLRKYIGAYRAVVGGLDAVVFTGTVGVRWWQLRHRTLTGLDQLGMKLDEEHNRKAITFSTEEDVATVDSPVRILVIPNNEMLVVAEDTAAIVRGIYAPHLQYPYTFSSPDFVLRGTVPLPSTVR
ncbi:MAG TPA: propionate kinase, partial [Geobacterales bacterium]|nr:propionate kinase [Geobacterales bacterium]